MLLAAATALSSAQPAPHSDSLVATPMSLVPLKESATSAIEIPKPNYTPPDTAPRKWDGVVSKPTPKERVPGFVSRSLYSAAILTSGVLLTYAGIAYWQNRQAADDVVKKTGVNPLGLMAVATISIPVGAVLAVVGGTALIANLGSIGSRSEEGDPDRE